MSVVGATVNDVIRLLHRDDAGLFFPDEALSKVEQKLAKASSAEELFRVLLSYLSLTAYLSSEGPRGARAGVQLLAMIEQAALWLLERTGGELAAAGHAGRVLELAREQRRALAQGPATQQALGVKPQRGVRLRSNSR